MISMRCAAIFAVCIAAALPGFSRADEYPSRPIKVVIPFAAGGGGDIAVRVLTDALTKKLGQGVVVENRPGPYGVAAAQTVKAAEPDGYSMVVLGNIHAIGQTMMKSVSFDVVNDFVPIVTFAYADVVVFTSPKSSLSNLKDVIERAKATPGTFNIGTGLVGTTQFLTAELFKSTAQLNIPIVSFRTSGELATAVMRGDVAIGFELIPAILGPLESGSLKPIAVSSGARFPRLPQTSTFAESGLGTSVTSWAIFAAPAGTPMPIIDRLNKEVAAIVADPEVQGKFSELGYTLGGGTPQDAKRLLVSEIDRWKSVIEAAKLPGE